MKLVICSCSHLDLHVGSYDVHDDIVDVMRRIIDATHGADLFVHCGDVFNTNRPSPRAYATIIELLNQLGCPVVILCGNHDPDALEPLKKVEFSQEVRVVDRPCALAVGGKHFMFVPHISDAKAKKMSIVKSNFTSAQALVNSMFESARCAHEHEVEGVWRIDCIFAHLNVEGAKLSTEYIMREQELALPIKVAKSLPVPVVVGHIHCRQKIEPNIWITGSVIPVNFGEKDDQKSYLEITI